jgi:ammonia channel protein AmtB
MADGFEGWLEVHNEQVKRVLQGVVADVLGIAFVHAVAGGVGMVLIGVPATASRRPCWSSCWAPSAA